MDDLERKFIDSAIREFSTTDQTGYRLHVTEISDYIQRLIDERIDRVYAEDMYRQGLTPQHDSQTGEVTWRQL